jgi:hypothetical protein
MATTKELKVKIDATINAEASIKTLKELKLLQKQVGLGSAEYKKLEGAIDDMSDSLKGAKKGAADWVDTLENAGGPLGMVGAGINKMKVAFSSFNTALKASVIGIIVGLLGGMVAAFSSNEKAMKKLQPIFIAFEKILGGIFTALEPLLDMFVELAMTVLPYLTDAIGGIYSVFSGLFTFIKTYATGVGKVLKGIFTLDLDSLKEGVKDLTNIYSTSWKATKETYAKFQEGAKDETKTEKEEREKRQKLAEEDKAKREKLSADELARRKGDLDAKIELEVKQENTSREKLEALYKQKYEAEIQGQKLSDAQKLLLRKQYQQKVEDALNEDKAKRQKDYEDGIKLLQSNSKLELDQLNANLTEAKVIYGENSKEARKTQDEIFQAQKEALDKETELLNKKGDLTEEEKIRLKSIVIEQQNLTTAVVAENKKRLESDNAALLKKGEDTKKASDKAYQDKMSAAAGDYELQQQILDDKIEQEKKFYEEQLAIIGLTDEQKKALQEKQTADVKANADAQVQIQKAKTEAELAFLNASANAINAVADIIGKNTKTGKALAVAASLINTYSAIAGQLKAFAGVPIPGYAIAQAIATGLVGYKAVSDIISVKVPTTSSGTASVPSGASVSKPRGLAMGGYVSGEGTSTSDSIPALLSNGESVINAASTQMFKPLLSTINQIGGGRQFASGGISSSEFSQSSAMTSLTDAIFAQQQPIKTYVVSSDMTNQQMMDRTIKMRSTI